MIFKNKCYNGGKQHKFEARYDEVPLDRKISVKRGSEDGVRSMMYYNVYVYDICVWCGKVVGRKK